MNILPWACNPEFYTTHARSWFTLKIHGIHIKT
jgi:hypothetical protein